MPFAESEVFCVYEHWRPDTNACFYVGKGNVKRANLVSRKENSRHSRVVAKLKRQGLCVEVRFYAKALTEPEAFRLEVARIAELRDAGVDLCNFTNGGEGASGNRHSDESKLKISVALKGVAGAALRGRKLPQHHREKIAEANRGRTVSEETRAKISAAQKGKTRPELMGRPVSEETREKLKNREFSEEHRAKISQAKKGKPVSAEHRAKISAALKERFARERAAKGATSQV